MSGSNALVMDDVVETIANVSVILKVGSDHLKRLARESNNEELMALSLVGKNCFNALREAEYKLENQEEVREPGVDQVTPATP